MTVVVARVPTACQGGLGGRPSPPCSRLTARSRPSANKSELTDVTGYQTFRQVAWAGSFEGYSSLGLGVRARLPFRVQTLPGPGAGSRLVLDVAHFW